MMLWIRIKGLRQMKIAALCSNLTSKSRQIARAFASALTMVATGVTADRYAAFCDSVWLDMSKGLGCPVGGVLAGSASFIEAAWRWKTRLGGAMRQAGILAAAGLHALEHHVDRLADDHRNAQVFAKCAAQATGVRLDPADIETNIVLLDVSATGLSPATICKRLEATGVRLGIADGDHIRAVTHIDVSAEEAAVAGERFAQIIAAMERCRGD